MAVLPMWTTGNTVHKNLTYVDMNLIDQLIKNPCPIQKEQTYHGKQESN